MRSLFSILRPICLYFVIVQICLAKLEWPESHDDLEKLNEQKGYFKICNAGEARESYSLDAEKCPHGLWMSEPVKGYRGCVQLNGIWVISFGHCDQNYVVAYGKGHSFKLDNQVQKLLFLGDPEDAFESFNYIIRENGRSSQRLSNQVLFPLFLESSTGDEVILRLRPEAGNNLHLETEHSGPICLNSDRHIQGSNSDETLLIYNPRVSISSIESLDFCPILNSKDHTKVLRLLPGQMVHINSGQIFTHNERCSFQCVTNSKDSFYKYIISRDEKHFNGSLVRRKRQEPEIRLDLARTRSMNSLTDQPLDARKESKGGQAVDYENGDDGDDMLITQKGGGEDSSGTGTGSGGSGAGTGSGSGGSGTNDNQIITETQDFAPLKLDREFTEGENDHTVNIANMRVVKQELNWLLEGIRPPTLNHKNWKLMRKLKEVFVAACPDNEAPKFIVNAMMRLFRLFYLNTKDFYPNGHMMEEKEQFSRLEQTLDACMKDATAMEFNQTMIKDDKFPCRTQTEEVQSADGNFTEETVTYCRCNEKLSFVNMSYSQNLTGPGEALQLYEGGNLTIQEILAFKMAQQVETFGEYRDYPTETMWKVIMFGHYYCSKYFRDTPADHSALMTRVEDFFNEDIIYRWTRPGAHASKIWQFLYSAFNLKKFANAVDACVASAKAVSEYPEWLNRPTFEVRRRKKRSLGGVQIWDGTAYCLQTQMNSVAFSSSHKCT